MSLPQLALIGTGGTIAGAAAHATSTTRYQPASLGIEAVVQSVPELQARYRLKLFQPMQLGSYDVTPEHWRELHEVVTHALADPDTQGAVITHGTDTLEETATFLSLSIASDKPVVVIGAMRPATAHSADGPANVLDACTVAADPQAAGRGSLVVMNGRIHSGLRVTKRHVSSVEAFESPLAGALGEVADQSVRWFGPAHRCPPVTGPLPVALPRVDVVVSYAGADDVALKACVAAGARGIVHAGLGNANAPAGNRDWFVAATMSSSAFSVRICASSNTSMSTSSKPRPKPCSRAPNMITDPLAKWISCSPFADRIGFTARKYFDTDCRIANPRNDPNVFDVVRVR